ncbi:MAG TPA: hypothetical protein VFR12_10580 [Pyrinomonadaceae bacterium]|nr:hypothetical protein [Pyrinomonadaceae bacterium]
MVRTTPRGLDDALTQHIDEALKRIIRAPYFYPIVYKHLRRAVVHKFPFAIYYEPHHGEIVVFAVYHSSRDLDKLESRLLGGGESQP